MKKFLVTGIFLFVISPSLVAVREAQGQSSHFGSLLTGSLEGIGSISTTQLESGVRTDSWSSGVSSDKLLAHATAWGGSWWAPGLTDFSITIKRESHAYKNGIQISSSNISIGDRVSFTAPIQDTDISWFGVGYTWDSPYGHWIADAAAPASVDMTNDFVNSYVNPTIYNYTSSIYVPFSVNPPTMTYTHAGSTAGLDCDGDNVVESNPVGSSCKVMSGGTVETQVNYAATYGKFYYHYEVPLSGYPNYYNKDAMRQYFGSWADCSTDSGCGNYAGSDYVVNIPAKTLSFRFTASGSTSATPNQRPSVPTVTPQPFTGTINTAYPFTFTATDPDNDQIAYEVDWNRDGRPDESTPFVNSGTSQSLSNPIRSGQLTTTLIMQCGQIII